MQHRPEGPSLDAIVAAFLERGISQSLASVEQGMAAWRNGAASALTVHSIVMRHAARISLFLEEVARATAKERAAFVREAVGEGLLTEVDAAPWLDATEGAGDTGTPAALGAGALAEASANDATAGKPTSLMNIARGVLNPDKQRVVSELLGEGSVLVHIDARRDGVVVPEKFRQQSKLVLRFGYALTPSIPDLTVDDTQLSGTLMFGGLPFLCVLPWHAVYAVLVDGTDRGHVWPEDVPELSFVAPAEEREGDGDGDGAGRSVGEREDAGLRRGPSIVPPHPSGTRPEKKSRPSHLRLVD